MKNWEPKIGQTVVVQSQTGPRMPVHTQLLQVEKITAAMVVMENGDRFNRANLTGIGMARQWHLVREALPADFAAEQAKLAADKARRDAREAEAAKKQKLETLFPKEMRPSVLDGTNNQGYNLEFHSLTESQIERLATHVAKSLTLEVKER